MAKMKPRKKGPDMSKLDESALDNLSEAEKEQFLIASGRKPKITTPEGTVSQKAHEDAVNELKDKISNLDTKLSETKDELASVRGEKDDYKSRFDRKLEENRALEEENEGLKTRNRELSDKVQDLDGKLKRRAEETVVVRDDAEIKRLGKEVEGLKTKLKSKEDEYEALESENASLKAGIDDLEKEIQALRESKVESMSLEGEGEIRLSAAERVRRTSPTTFESALFTDKKYLVKLARSGRTISFTPDVEGAAVCVDGTIRLPRLADLVPFDGETEYDTMIRDGSEIVVVLV